MIPRRLASIGLIVVTFTLGCGDTTGEGATAASGGGTNGGGDAGGGTGTCEAVGLDCTDDDQCCTGLCEPAAGVCAKVAGVCIEGGDPCGSGPECCSFACVDGACSTSQCVADNEACGSDGECCGGVCGDGTCVALNPECKTSGNPCTSLSDCCSQYCVDGICDANPSYCTQTGDTCATDVECCAGLCNKTGDAALGTCALAPASGASECKTAGELCSDGAMYTGGALPICGGECCSRACFPYGPTGVLICEPPSGCHPTGELCKVDTDCCGAEGLPDGDTAHITCSKEPGALIGRCDQGNACTPAGGICRLQDVECNANANCCAGNVLQFDTCAQDNLGIPRCLGAEIDCTDPSDFVGLPCASSADCCGLPCVPNPAGDPPLVCGAACVPVDGPCTTDADCCTGLPCVIEPGSTMGTCGTSTGCAEYGQSCTMDSDCCNGIPCIEMTCKAPPPE